MHLQNELFIDILFCAYCLSPEQLGVSRDMVRKLAVLCLDVSGKESFALSSLVSHLLESSCDSLCSIFLEKLINSHLLTSPSLASQVEIERAVFRLFSHSSFDDSVRLLDYCANIHDLSKKASFFHASLHFRCAMNSCLLNSDIDKTSFHFQRAYKLRRDLFELCRVYHQKSDYTQVSLNPVKFDVIKDIVNTIHVGYAAKIDSSTIADSVLYGFIKDVFLMLGDPGKVSAIEDAWLTNALMQCRRHLSDRKSSEAIRLAIMAIESHPTKAVDPSLSSFYKVISDARFIQNNLNESNLFGRFACAIKALPNSPSYSDLILKLSKHKTIIFCNVSSRYADMFVLWHRAFARHSISGLMVGALDSFAYDLVSPIVDDCYLDEYFFYQSDFIWGTSFPVRRAEMLFDLVARGHNALITGVDSIWLGDPLPMIESLDFDIVAMGLSTVTQNFTTMINHDFLYIRSNPSTIAFLGEYVQLARRVKSDQHALNQLLFEHGLTWNQNSDGGFDGKTRSILPLNVKLLPLSLMGRSLKDVGVNSIIFQPSGPVSKKILEINKVFTMCDRWSQPAS